jgi:hypothetical protein
LTHWWEILCEPLLFFGQFHGYTHLSKGQSQGICFEESQPPKRTLAARAAQANIWLGKRTRESNIPPDSTGLDETPHPAAKNAGARHRFILEYQRYT